MTTTSRQTSHTIAKVARRLRLDQAFVSTYDGAATFYRDREGGEYVVRIDADGVHVCFSWPGSADIASEFRRGVETLLGRDDR